MIDGNAQKTLIEALVSLGVGLFTFLLVLLLRMDYEIPAYIPPYSDACLAAGAVLFGYAGLRFVTRSGALDILGYSGYALFTSFRPNPTERKYKTAYDYKEGMTEKRKSSPAVYWPWLAFAALFLVAAGALAIAYSLAY